MNLNKNQIQKHQGLEENNSKNIEQGTDKKGKFYKVYYDEDKVELTPTYILLKRYQNKKYSRSSKSVANIYYFKVIITNSLGISNLVIMLAIRVIHVAADILV